MNGQTLNHQNGAVPMQKRERIRLERIQGDKNRVTDGDARVVWYDARKLDDTEAKAVLPRLATLGYTGVVFGADDVEARHTLVSPTIEPMVYVRDRAELEGALASAVGERIVIASDDVELLAECAETRRACLFAYVDDKDSLHAAIQRGARFSHLAIKFRDPTNIPLELVIASLQATRTVLVKEIADGDVDDAIVTLGVMEVGADGVMFSPTDHALLDVFATRLKGLGAEPMQLQVGTVIGTRPVGMGYRSCIDLATLFSPTEGMLVGSTSQGGILCCPEVFFLPYMELRPFRVNAGAVHSYVYNTGDRTDYMTELRAGTEVMIVDASGKTRTAPVGRMKTEMRPLRLIEVEFPGGERVNVLMQDDWHVRVFSHDAKPLNITELRPGDRVLGYVASPGRHVGIKVDEHIVET